jgi:AraC-like DNA-binding protein
MADPLELMRERRESSMDAVAGLLDGPRARRLHAALEHGPALVAAHPRRGTAHALRDRPRGREGDPVRLAAGDAAVFRGPDHYTVADDPATPPQVVIHPGQRCTTPEGEDLSAAMSLGVRTWGNSPDGATVTLTGTYQMDGEVSGRLRRALPPLLVMRREEWNSPLIPLLASEVAVDDPGQEAVLDRLLDLLLIAVLRAWFARPEAEAPGWYRAYADPVVGPALRLMHNAPERPWSVAELARASGASRAALARRFTELVGQPPIRFLAEWRIALAADLLLEPGATIGSVAPRVGYGSPLP